VITVRSDIWRVFDFFWMLHIMDYDEREDFNNPLLISFAASSVFFSFTGFILLLQNIRLRTRKRKLS
jgi:exosortase/archaeosortase